MTPEEYVKDKVQDLAKHIDDQIPVNYGFILLVFPTGPQGVMQYVANCERSDAVQLMYEWIAVTSERTYGTEQEESGEDGFDRWRRNQNVRWNQGSPEGSAQQW